jgi:aryl-alcohol dehydrogenase-like predicted oxidoreductase
VGVNCFDTAEGYGMGASERALGKALGSRRDEAVIVSKFGMNYRDKPNLRDSSRERVFASIDKSLKNLGTDWLDAYLVHWPDRLTPFEETMGALEEVVRDGKVRAVGLSNFKLEEIEACRQAFRVDVVQYGWNMFDRRMQREILPYCQEHGIGFMAYGSLCFGLLTGTFTEDMDFGSEDWRSRQGKMGSIKMFENLFGAEAFPRNVRAVEELKGIAARYDKSLPQLALRWAISHPAISTALVGCRNVAEVDDNIGAVGWSIGDADLAEIDAIFERHGVDTTPDYWIEEA